MKRAEDFWNLTIEAICLRRLVDTCHARAANFRIDPKTRKPIKRNFGERIALIHSELSEALEGHRKDLMDDKLPHRKMIDCEIADAIIRLCDLAGDAECTDVPGALAEKLEYNRTRADHKLEN